MQTNIDELAARGSRTARTRKKASATHPKTPDVCPDPPSWLRKDAKKLWKEHAAAIHQLGALSILDTMAVGMLFTAMAEHLAHAAVVEREGAVVVRGHYEGPHPEAKLRDDAAKRVVTLMRQCGLTRSGRNGMSLEPVKPKVGEIIDKRGGFAT